MIFAVAIPFSLFLAGCLIYCLFLLLYMLWHMITYPFRTRRPPRYLLTEAQMLRPADPQIRGRIHYSGRR